MTSSKDNHEHKATSLADSVADELGQSKLMGRNFWDGFAYGIFVGALIMMVTHFV